MLVWIVTTDNGRVDSVWSTQAAARQRLVNGVSLGQLYATGVEPWDVDESADVVEARANER